MKFTLLQATEILERTPAVLNTLLRDLSPEWTSNNEGGDSWSAYDVIGHLIHGDRSDWMVRAHIILGENNQQPFAPYNRTAMFEESKDKTLPALLDEFALVRTEKLKELRDLNLSDTQLKRTGIHPAFGAVTLQQLLATWAAHDLSHINQITRVLAKQYKTEVGPWVEYMSVMK